MIQVEQFDAKTGKPIQVVVEGQWQPAVKRIENSYLEHWCRVNGIEPAGRFAVAQFYESVHDSDRRQLESEGKYLVFSSDSEGYFTDYATAQLMTLGREKVEPIYAADRYAAHNAVAYGSLVSSDGVASTTLSSARILVIDDSANSRATEEENRGTPGKENSPSGKSPLLDRNKEVIPHHQLAHLYDKMGDGTMLVSDRIMRSLQTVEEKDQIVHKAAERSAVRGELSTLTQDTAQVETALDVAESQEIALARRSVYQFRAASPSMPGIAKGTMTSSQWCERLDVAAIISVSDIKGDDGRFSEPGVKEVSDFWVNRKTTAKYGRQTVGPQVKNTIPIATRDEINPRVQEAAVALAEVAGDYDALSQRYLAEKARERDRPYQSNEEELPDSGRIDWLENAIATDTYGQLNGEAHLVRGLESYIKGKWQRLTTNGTSVPSAMAQHHSKLRPWEVCNKDLPHGALVAYYRSPFPNVGAAAIAINNIKVIEQQDREAFSKQGVVYLNPEIAKEVAITDFDGDLNGFFVGYTPTVGDLPEQLRTELADVEGLSATKQYGYARDWFEAMLELHENGEDTDVEPGDYPVAVKEFIQRNASDVKPPQIAKQEKDKHSWPSSESHSEATWRAWSITADNPTAKVANACMSLQALSNELRYVPESKTQELLTQVSNHFSEVLRKADLPEDHKEKIYIPSDEWLTEQGFSDSYRESIEKIAQAGPTLPRIKSGQQRQAFINSSLSRASNFLSKVANGPGAVNLQTAVDTAKSARGIDEQVHDFMIALRYEKDALKANKNNPAVYTRDNNGNQKKMPTTLSEPVSWGAELVNEQYAGVVMEEKRHQEFQAVYPKYTDPARKARMQKIIDTSNKLQEQAKHSKRRDRERRPEDKYPTVVAATNGRQLTFHSIKDEQGTFPWRGEGVQPNWTIEISRNVRVESPGKRYPATLRFVDKRGQQQSTSLGSLSTDSAVRYSSQLEDKFNQLPPSGTIKVSSPHITTLAPWSQQNDSKLLYAKLDQYITDSLAPPAGKDPEVHAQEMALSLWRESKGGRKLSMQHFPEQLSERIAERPEHMVIQRFQLSRDQAQRLVTKSPHTIQFGRHQFDTTKGPQMYPTASVPGTGGKPFLLGSISSDTLALPERATYMATFSHDAKSDKIVHMQIMDLPTVE